jgi:hypothetical protein
LEAGPEAPEAAGGQAQAVRSPMVEVILTRTREWRRALRSTRLAF